LYAGDKDIDVEMEMYGGNGSDQLGGDGGEGGYSKIRFTMAKDEEYILTGLFDAVNAPFLYRKATLIAVVGEGGDGGTIGAGGQGGGVDLGGANGGHVNGGGGGARVAVGEMPANGVFGSNTNIVPYEEDQKVPAPNGGRTIKCTKGDYWRDQGKSPCVDLGTIKFRTPDGTEISNTAEIARGYKAGYNIIQTKGDGRTVGAGGELEGGGTNEGGSGAFGGMGGSTEAGGGGGGSGYTDGSVTVISTQEGGSTGAAKVIIRIADPNTIDPSTALEEVSFTVTRSAAYSNTITFVKESGTGPDRITFGPNAGTVTASMGAGAVYTRESVLVNGAPGGNVRLSDGVLQLEDAGDNDYNDLTVSPNNGKFTSATRYEFT